MNDRQRFKNHLEESHNAVWMIADRLAGKGHTVTVNPTNYIKCRENWDDFSDRGDLYIQLRVEVKKLGVDFTNRSNWPFGQKFIVCAKHSFDGANPKPHCYYILNNKKTHAALVMSDTSKSWYTEKRTDRRYEDMTQDFYLCPINLVKFISQ